MISGETKSKVKIESGSNQKSERSAGRENCAGTEPDKQKMNESAGIQAT
jgi:hypothetical protein